MLDYPKIQNIINSIDYEPVFVSVSGAHLYGFESYNSDADLRGCHIPTLHEGLRYSQIKDTMEYMRDDQKIYPLEVDIVSHSLIKYIHLMTKSPNGYILEQLFSPLIICTSELHKSLKELASYTITKELVYHYGGFFENQKRLLSGNTKQVKLVLYQLRIIASAIYTARTGLICANLCEVNDKLSLFDKDKLHELIEIKRNGEKDNFPDSKILDYWNDVIKNTFPLIQLEFDQSFLPNFDRQLIDQKVKEWYEKNCSLIWK